ncbi:MAG TPA: PilC/PilY family type IV pilus protein [Pseudomonadales bacterium]|nr:PilC/PilY family type IV pilus protein [Pseudomonadales bacterium]
MKTTSTGIVDKIAVPRRLRWQLAGVAAGLLTAVPAFANFNYSTVPVFWSSGTQPNVMLLLDDSGSMRDYPSGSTTVKKIDSLKAVAKQVVTDNASKMRIGMFHFYSNSDTDAGGKYALPCGTDAATLKTEIDALSASNSTPLASALYEVTRYFRGMTPYNTSENGTGAFPSPIQYRCQKNFTVVLTDGKPTSGMEYPGATYTDRYGRTVVNPPGTVPTDTTIGGVTNPWGSSQTLAATNSWDAYPDPYMAGDSDGYNPLLDDIAQFAFDIDMKDSSSTPSGTCPSGSVGQTNGRDCAGKSWQDSDAGSTGEFAQQNMTTYTIGFDVQTELLNDAPLTNRIAFAASNVDVANDVINIPNHGLKTGDYVQFYSTGPTTASISGIGQVDPANTITAVGASSVAAGTALTYSNAGGASLQHSVFSSQTDTMTLTSAPAVGNIFTAPLSQITNLTNGTPVTAAATDSFYYEGNTITSAAFNNSKSNTTDNYFLLGYPAFQIMVGQPMTYNERGSGSSFPLVNGTTYYVQSCAGSVGTGTGTNSLAVNTVGTPCPPQAVNNIVKFSASAGGPVKTLPFTGTSTNNQSFTFKPTIPGKSTTFYISGLNTTTGQFCLSLTSGGACVNIPVPGGGTQSWTWSWTHTVNNPTTASTYYAIPVDSTHIKLALTQANATASTPVPVQIYNGGNVNQTFTYSLSSSVGGLYGYETDLEPDSTPDPATESAARGKYCVVRVDANNFSLAKAYPGGSVICPATPSIVNITNPGNGGILSNGPGESYYSTDGASLSTALNAAFNSINEKNLSFGGTSSNGTTLSTGSRIYQAIFNTKTWSSTILAKAFVNGVLSSTSSWGTMDTMVTVPRTILTYKPSTAKGIALSTTPATAYTQLDASQQQAVSGSNTASATTGANVISWLQGVVGTTVQVTNFRTRSTSQLIGDIIDSGMIYVGGDDYKLNTIATGGSSYDAYVTAKSAYEPMIYAGANDGMVHGFRASDGHEMLAFIPNGVYRDWTDADNNGVAASSETTDWKLFNLTQEGYLHRYFVNGSPAISDAYLPGAPTVDAALRDTNGWTTVLVGGLKQGGRSIYALNVYGNSATVGYGDAKRVMWEYGLPTATTDADKKEVGYTFGTPTIAQVKNAGGTGTQWAVIFGNGYDSASKKAQLFVVDLATGTLIKRLDTGRGGTGTGTSAPNGLSEPAVVLDANKVVKYVYAGDLQGNVWKFDLTSGNTSWANPSAPLFTTSDTSGNPQPITAGVAVGTNPANGNTMVYVVTGKYFEQSDAGYTASGTGATVPHVQTVYGIQDGGSAVGTLDRTTPNLVKQTFGSIVIAGTTYRTISNNTIDYSTKKGWFIDLVDGTNYEGEMGINTPIVHDSRLILTSLIPTNPSKDPCIGVGGTGNIMEFKASTGTADTTQGFFDINGDGTVDANEKQVVGIEVDGILSNPTILTNADGKTETKIGSKASVTGSTYQFQETKDQVGGIPVGRMSWRQLQ